MNIKKNKNTWFELMVNHEGFWIIALSILLIPQVASSVKVFATNNVQYESPWFSWCYAIGIDLAILIFTVKGKLKLALLYLVVMIAHALIGQFLPAQSAYGLMLVHLTLPITIFSFSHLFYYEKKNAQTQYDSQTKAKSEQVTAMIAQGIRIEPQPFICPECGEGAATAKRLNGHISGHKHTGAWNPEKYGDWIKENELRNSYVIQSQLKNLEI